MRMILMIFCMAVSYASAAGHEAGNDIPPDTCRTAGTPFEKAVSLIKETEGWHGKKEHWPYVGFGHKVLPGEKLTNGITREQGDSLLRADLRKLCRTFSYLGRDSLIISVLAYNVGVYRLKGYGKIPKSRLLKKLEAGNRDIYEEYVSFRCYRGKVIPSIERRRKKEFELLFEK